VAIDSSRITDGELQRLVVSWGQKAYKNLNNQTTPTSPQRFGRVSRKIIQKISKNITFLWSKIIENGGEIPL